MNYELAKELKDAGFPQFWSDRHWFYNERTSPPTRWCINALESSEHIPHNADDEANWLVAYPTLEELILECEKHPRGFCFVRKIDGEWYAQDDNMRGTDNGWDGKIAKGTSPVEAVARLWLALNKKV